jgi:hypothetical protein
MTGNLTSTKCFTLVARLQPGSVARHGLVPPAAARRHRRGRLPPKAAPSSGLRRGGYPATWAKWVVHLPYRPRAGTGAAALGIGSGRACPGG